MSKNATFRSRRKISGRSRRSCRDVEAASRTEVIREFDRAERISPTEEERIYVYPSTN